ERCGTDSDGFARRQPGDVYGGLESRRRRPRRRRRNTIGDVMKFWLFGKWLYILLALFLAPILASPLLAQTTSGTLRCQVNDPSGGLVTQATVLVTSATGQTQAVQGNRDGG